MRDFFFWLGVVLPILVIARLIVNYNHPLLFMLVAAFLIALLMTVSERRNTER